MKKNTLYVTFKTDSQRDSLVEEYTLLGYYVQVRDGRIAVSSKHPKKVKDKKDEKGGKSERPRRKADRD